MKKTLVSVFVLLITAGCGSAVTSDSETYALALQEDERTLTRTIVYLHPDGTEQVAVDYISPSEQQAEIAAHEAMLDEMAARDESAGTIQQAIGHDTGCAGSSMWLFDQPNQQGNQICFYGTGTVDLGSYFGPCTRPNPPPPFWICMTWALRKQSYRAGQYGGHMGAGSSLYCTDTATCGLFFANTQRNSLSTCEQNARYLRLGSLCTPPSVRQDTSYATSGQLFIRGSGFRPNSKATVTYYNNGSVWRTVRVDVEADASIADQYGNVYCAASSCGCNTSVSVKDDSTGLTASRNLGICFY